jgi:hypothetical protein
VRLETAVVAACFARRFEAGKGASGNRPPFLSRLSRLLEVIDRQPLTRMALSLSEAQHEAKGAVSPGARLDDPAFSFALLEVV